MRNSLLLLIAVAGTAAAGTVTVSGSIGAANPTMPVAFITAPVCSGQGSTPVHYQSIPFMVDTSGTYNFSLTATPPVGSLYLYQNSFNPASSFTNCVAADNIAPIAFSFGLTTGTPYFAVPFDDSFAQGGFTYSLTIDGPGNITVGVPEPATILLLGVSLIVLAGLRRLRSTVKS